MTEIRIAGVVVLYNPDKNVKNNISYYANKFDELYLIDNSSENNASFFGEILAKRHVHYIALLHNAGIAYALNVGFRESQKRDCQCAISLDQDSSFYTDIVSIYRMYLLKHNAKEIAALSPCYITGRSSFKPRKEFREISRAMQSGTLFLLDKWEQIGIFNERLFLDVVDWEYFFRIKKADMKIIQCSNAILIHQPAETKFVFRLPIVGKVGIGFAAPIRYYYQVRNLTWCVLTYKNFVFIKTIIFKYLKILLFFDNKKEYLNLCRQGISDAMKDRLGSYEMIHK